MGFVPLQGLLRTCRSDRVRSSRGRAPSQASHQRCAATSGSTRVLFTDGFSPARCEHRPTPGFHLSSASRQPLALGCLHLGARLSSLRSRCPSSRPRTLWPAPAFLGFVYVKERVPKSFAFGSHRVTPAAAGTQCSFRAKRVTTEFQVLRESSSEPDFRRLSTGMQGFCTGGSQGCGITCDL